MSSLFQHLAESFRRPDHWVYASWLDTVTKYRKTSLGVLWLLVPTIVYIWGIGGFLAALQPSANAKQFLAHVAVGFVVFRLIITVVSDATGAFDAYQSYIYDGNLRLTDFILRTLARSIYYFVFTMPLLAVAVLGSPEFQAAGVPAALFGVVVVIVNLFLFAVLLSFLGARFPDIGELMGSVMMAAFLITPVVWYPAAAPEGTVHGALMRANPFHHLLSVIRAPLLNEPLEPLTWYYLAAMTVVGVIGAALAYRAFARRVPVWL